MKPAQTFRELTGEQRRVVAQLAIAYGVSPNEWSLAPALRECVEQLAVANVADRIKRNPTTKRRSEKATWIRAAQLLDLTPGTLLKRRERTREQAAVVASTEQPTAPQADALSPTGLRPNALGNQPCHTCPKSVQKPLSTGHSRAY